MFYLFLAIICSALISLIMRVSEKHISGDVSMLMMNYCTCLLIASGYTIGNHLGVVQTGWQKNCCPATTQSMTNWQVLP